jgi:hypothetical protein
LTQEDKKDKMSSEEKPELHYVSNYDWDAIVDWAREKEKEGAELAQQREDEEKERTKSAAAKDLLEALEEQQIVDEIEIKQEIVLDPNE